ncbi:MAG: SpoIIE family protein phosphatase, partial [Planctomycetaceae bacterium]|nr:SpoIIE family protein phosphatase [Planctomycetaceae bacterium]
MIFPTPIELIEALQNGDAESRRVAQEQLDGAWKTLSENLARSYGMMHPQLVETGTDGKALASAIRDWVVRDLRTLTQPEMDQITEITLELPVRDAWKAFYEWGLTRTYRLFLWESQQSTGPSILDETNSEMNSESTQFPEANYQVEVYLKPCDSVGGDWIVIDCDQNQQVWTFLGDMPGHGWGPYILKKRVQQGIVEMWQDFLKDSPRTPNEFFRDLDRYLVQNRVIPETQIEATAGVFRKDGTVEISSAGAGYLLSLDSETREIRYQHPDGGFFLNFLPEHPRTRSYSTTMNAGQELTMTSDGLPEQPIQKNRLG